jgi:hypothetical protein
MSACVPPKCSVRGTDRPCLCSRQLILPPCLTARQRAVLHQLAEQHGLQHESSGEGTDRRLTLGPADAATKTTATLPPELAAASDISDEQLAALVKLHLGINASPFLAGPGPSSSSSMAPSQQAAPPQAVSPTTCALGKRVIREPSARGLLTVEDFIAKAGLLGLQHMRADSLWLVGTPWVCLDLSGKGDK